MKRVNVHFSDRQMQDIEEMVEEEGTSISEIIRRAVRLKMWLANQQARGARIFLENEKEKVVIVYF